MVLPFKNIILISINKIKYDYIINHIIKNIFFKVSEYILIYLTLIILSFYREIKFSNIYMVYAYDNWANFFDIISFSRTCSM